VYRSTDFGSSWSEVAFAAHWVTVSVEASGQYQAAADYEGYSGTIIMSSDYGRTWKAVTPPSGIYWLCVAIGSGMLIMHLYTQVVREMRIVYSS